LDPIESTWVASHLQNTPNWSKLWHTGYRNSSPMFCTLGYKPWWGCCVPVVTSLVSDVYHLLHMCRVHLEFRIIIHL